LRDFDMVAVVVVVVDVAVIVSDVFSTPFMPFIWLCFTCNTFVKLLLVFRFLEDQKITQVQLAK